MAPKAFKVRVWPGDRKYGLRAESLKELLWKASQLEAPYVLGCRLCFYEDGVEVTEAAFRALLEDPEMILLRPGEEWNGYSSMLKHFLNTLSNRSTHEELVRAVQQLLSGEDAPERCKVLDDLIQSLDENIPAENREDDERWFEGVESRFKTKSSYMRYNCESRIRGYMKEVRAYISAAPPALQMELNEIAKAMLENLKLEKYNGFYFDRKEESLCTPEGWFSCQGSFDTNDCSRRHSINPYGNRESRILFSTWNFDHIIEKKRVVLPDLVKAVENRNGRKINSGYFYQLLFTKKNFKLVHIVCHKKTVHNLSCKPNKFYLKPKAGQKNHTLSKNEHNKPPTPPPTPPRG